MIYPWRVIRDLTQPLAEKRRQITEMDAELNASRSNPSYQNRTSNDRSQQDQSDSAY
jgi:hypothetical protein